MGLLFQRFIDEHPDLDNDAHGAEMTDEQEAQWRAYSAEALARHQAQRAALATELEAEQRRS
ncbi:hypothetical protein [Mycobacterium neglectum]|uniref:hypothetical protein n=1 Tax=Mycobacterium neglectum TaxID=242737 RepID=UPI000BFECE06|nr:hypothetical protein [Mycobacterium neglectum]